MEKELKNIKTFEQHTDKNLNISDNIHSFIVTYRSNYGLNVIIINSENIETAKLIAEEKTKLKNEYTIDGYEIEEIDLITKGLVFYECS